MRSGFRPKSSNFPQMASTSAAGFTSSIMPLSPRTLGVPTSARQSMCLPMFSSASASGSTSVNLPTPDLAAIAASALPPLPQPMTARCFRDSRSASFGLRANTGSIILNSSQSRLVDHGSAGIHDLDFHGSTFQALASEVVRVEVYSRILALHHPGDK